MARRPREFTTADGVLVEDLLHYGLDHISTAKHLLKGSASYYDGAGHLAHIGFELLLKAWLLHQTGRFPGTHKYVDLLADLKRHNPTLCFSVSAGQTIALLDIYEELRYPNRNSPIEIGSDGWDKVEALYDELWKQMPKELETIVNSLTPLRKGGRVLMEKKIDGR